MVKVQKPVPKKLAKKPMLDNPIKQKKQKQKKEKSATTVTKKNTKAELLQDTTPVKEAKVLQKPAKEVMKEKKNKKQLNGEQKTPKKPLILNPETSKAADKEKNVAKPTKSEKTTAVKLGKTQKKGKKGAAAPESSPSIEKIKKDPKPKVQLQEKKKLKIAFKKAQLAVAKDQPKKDKKKPEAQPIYRYDPIPYDEEKFASIVNKENIIKVAKALKDTVKKEISTKKSTIFEDYHYFLQVNCFKIPSCPKRMVKLNVKYPLVDKDDDVLLVVPDLQRGAKADFEPTKQHYEDLLRSNGIEGITIMPMNQLRKEFRTFEQKRRICASYEHYLCDGRIVGHVVAMLGKFTQKPRNTFHSLRLSNLKNIKREIEKSLKRTAYRQLGKNSLYAIPVGSHKFTACQLAENIEVVVDQLKTVFPGGLGNIRHLYLRIGLNGTSSLPLYVSMAQAPEKTPTVVGPREERMIKLKREANEVLSSFAMTKEGKMIKLTKKEAEKKRKLQEMKAALKEDGEEPAKKIKKASEAEAKKSEKAVDLELPECEGQQDEEEEEDDDDDSSEEEVQHGSDSDEESEDGQVINLEEEDTESGAEIVENGCVEDDDEESDENDEQEANQSDDDDEDEEDDDEDEAEESD